MPDWDAPLTNYPVDATARRVTGRGIHYEKVPHPSIRHTDFLPTRKPTNQLQRELTGVRFGRFRVIGPSADYAASVQRCSYVCVCACGKHEHRTAKAIRNPKNNWDCCMRCRQVKYQKWDSLRSQGINIPIEDV